MLSFLKLAGKSFFDLAYPPLCLHCNDPLENDLKLFCRGCLDLLVPIAPKERCQFCFSSEINFETNKCCQACRERSVSLDRMAAVFDYEGPAATLIKHLKYGGQPYLAIGAGAYLTAQFLALNWPIPDCIIPMPMAPLRRIERGYNQSLLLAQTVSGLLNCPVRDILKRRSGDFSQAGLNHQQRLELSHEAFSVLEGARLHDQCILLIDDVMTTGSSLRRCGEVLRELCPQNIYALTVCRTL